MSEVYTWEPSDAALAARYGVPVERIVRFDTNTTPWPPAFISEVLGARHEPPLNEYPDSSYADLTEAAAAYVGARPDEIVVAAGADEVLDLIAKAFLPAGGAAIVPTPTYAMFSVLTGQRAARPLALPRLGAQDGWRLDLDLLLRTLPSASVVWLCAPNNPTGAPEDHLAIERVLEAADPAIIVVDEAYHEFVGTTVVALRDRFPRLIVVRTLSKAFGLAGARVGYAVAARATIARLERVRPPGSVSTLSAALGATALRRPEEARARATAIAAERDWLAAGLAAVGWGPHPSVTNFVLVPFADTSAAAGAADALLREGLVPRTFPADHPLAGHLRLTVRGRPENERLLAVAASV